MHTQRPVPASRLSRLVQLGRLGSGIAGAVVGEGLRQIGNGNRPVVSDLLLTPANAHRLADRLSEMRGAAMKVGQLLSMEAGDILPEPLPDILSRLRDQALKICRERQNPLIGTVGPAAQGVRASLEWPAEACRGRVARAGPMGGWPAADAGLAFSPDRPGNAR